MKLTGELPRRDLIAVVISLGGITLLAWLYLVWAAKNMSMPAAAMQTQEWNSAYFLMMFLMWAIMMVGMMLPSAAPTILIYAAVARKAAAQSAPIAPTGAFVSGYIAIWVIFSFFATAAQWALDKTALLSPMMVSNNVWLGASLLIFAGIYQLLPIKNRCLQQCRSPFEFISKNWKKGIYGAFRMGISHGLFCLGCCWVIMLLLFVGGVMNLLWVAIIAVFILLEKVLPFGDAGGRICGIFMIAAGIVFTIL